MKTKEPISSKISRKLAYLDPPATSQRRIRNQARQPRTNKPNFAESPPPTAKSKLDKQTQFVKMEKLQMKMGASEGKDDEQTDPIPA